MRMMKIVQFLKNYFKYCVFFIFLFPLSAQTSYEELRFADIEKQENYYSCGISILNCILIKCRNIRISQSDIHSLIIAESECPQTKGGISLLDMKKILNSYGINTIGFKADIEEIQNIIDFYKTPIVLHYANQHIRINGQVLNTGHFVILYKIDSDFFYLLDPALGKIVITKAEIQKLYSGNCLVIKESFFEDIDLDEKARIDKLKYYSGK